MRRIEIINTAKELRNIKSDWNALYSQLGGEVSPFSSHGWYEVWWRHYSAGEELHIILMRNGTELVGIAPFMVRKANMHGLPVKAVCFIENNQTFFNDFIVLPEHRESFLRHVLETLRSSEQTLSWDLIFLNKMSIFSENYHCLKTIIQKKDSIWKEDQTVDARHIVPEGDWAEFLASRSKRTRKTLRNIQNSIHKAGEVTVRQIRTKAEFETVWDDVCYVAKGSWTEERGESLASPANIAFYDHLARLALEKGWLSLWTLSLDEKIIAVEFHLRSNRKAYAMRGHYLPEYEKLSPGTFLEMQILRHVFEEENRLEKYDLGNFYDYKRKWSDISEPHMALSIFNKGFYARLVSFYEMEAVPVLRRMVPKSFWENRLFKALGLKTAPFTIKQN